MIAFHVVFAELPLPSQQNLYNWFKENTFLLKLLYLCECIWVLCFAFIFSKKRDKFLYNFSHLHLHVVKIERKIKLRKPKKRKFCLQTWVLYIVVQQLCCCCRGAIVIILLLLFLCSYSYCVVVAFVLNPSFAIKCCHFFFVSFILCSIIRYFPQLIQIY